MSSLPRRRRVKKPTILVKRSQLAKNNVFNKRSYKPLYEKLKANNNALAKALSIEKQETRYLFSQNIALSGEIQELGMACNKRDEVISGVLKNAKETLKLMLTLSTYVSNTIASCQQVVTTTQFTPRKSNANNRRDSTRRLSSKSPARGVVQPMVSGHTITKPTINLSRLNIQREYRVQSAPNLSDVEEVLTPTQSPTTAETTTPVRIPIVRPLNYTQRVDRLPERFRGSMRVSDESERRSSARSNRNSGRRSGRRSHGTSDRLSESSASRRSTSELRVDERLRSPRVALHDVSRLLQNSQSVNIRTLLESSSDMELSQTQQTPDPVTNSPPETSSESVSPSKPEDAVAETSEDSEMDLSDTRPPSEASKSRTSGKKYKVPSPSNEEDPLEGPSWLLNEAEATSFFSETATTAIHNNSASRSSTKDHSRSQHRADSDDDEGNDDDENDRDEEEHEASKIADDDNGEDEEEEEEEQEEPEKKTANLTVRWADEATNYYRHLNDEDATTTAMIGPFVTRRRGSASDDNSDDYTLLWKRPGTSKNYDFDINDLELPVLESPIAAAPEPRAAELEPTVTANIQRITQTFGGFAPACPRANGEETIYEHTGLVLPAIAGIADSVRVSAALEEEEEEDSDEGTPSRKRKRQRKKRTNADSPGDSDYIPTPERKNSKVRRKASKAKDPSAAKVVLQKLNDTHVKKRAASTESRTSQELELRGSTSMQRAEVSSDSECSNASSTANAATSGRPRRHKAPMNLKEPSLTKKLRRN